MIINLIDQIKESVIVPSQISWIGSQDGKYTLPWGTFKKRFKYTMYDTEDASTELASDLVIKMADGSWYERDLNSGEWVHKRVPEKQPDSQQFDFVSELDSPNGSRAWDTLEMLNDEELFPNGGKNYATEQSTTA